MIIPINVQNIHWYISILHLNSATVTLGLQNNLKVSHMQADDELKNMDEKYQQPKNKQDVVN